MILRTLGIAIPFVLVACVAATGPSPVKDPFKDFEPVDAATIVPAPDPDRSKAFDADAAAHGKYLTELLGCGACHTDGALIGEPDPERLLAGSRIGIAHSNPLRVRNPGVVFPSNLTPDPVSGIGSMSDDVLSRAIRGGVNRHGNRALKVMPVAAYARISEEDTSAIVTYLRSLAPVRHEVPDEVPEGKKTAELFVHFGVYRNRLQ